MPSDKPHDKRSGVVQGRFFDLIIANDYDIILAKVKNIV